MYTDRSLDSPPCYDSPSPQGHSVLCWLTLLQLHNHRPLVSCAACILCSLNCFVWLRVGRLFKVVNVLLDRSSFAPHSSGVCRQFDRKCFIWRWMCWKYRFAACRSCLQFGRAPSTTERAVDLNVVKKDKCSFWWGKLPLIGCSLNPC